MGCRLRCRGVRQNVVRLYSELWFGGVREANPPQQNSRCEFAFCYCKPLTIL